MGKIFNTSGDCKPSQHYMVDIHGRLLKIKEMIDRGNYFSINQARQYGKTTILRNLRRFLQEEYLVISLDFQKEMSDAKFQNENVFSIAFANGFLWDIKKYKLSDSLKEATDFLKEELRDHRDELELVELFRHLSLICGASEKPIVLLIDEVDSAANNQVFLDFLGQLRGYYINRDEEPTFQSVILAGVYDVKNMKRKIRPEEEHKFNSPWNIAVDFDIDMSFSETDIAGMLAEYERDHGTGMDIAGISKEIWSYTSGYPFLVSRICKLLDENVAGTENFPDRRSAWTVSGVQEAVKMLLMEKNTLFESLINKLTDYPDLRQLLYSILFTGRGMPYNQLTETVDVAAMFGFVRKIGGNVAVSNRIFETVLYNWFLAQEALESDLYKAALQDKNQFIEHGMLNMELVLAKFVTHFHDLYGEHGDAFVEDVGRRYFLLYLKPIINGTGNYYIEAQTRDMERTDVIIDYRGQQFVIEMKVWRGNAYNERGERQLSDYLEYYHLEKGYMISFNFNKKKETGVKKVILGDKILVEAVV